MYHVVYGKYATLFWDGTIYYVPRGICGRLYRTKILRYKYTAVFWYGTIYSVTHGIRGRLYHGIFVCEYHGTFFLKCEDMGSHVNVYSHVAIYHM